MKARSENYDAVIVGGGPAGASAAIHLAARGARVLVAEQKKFPRAKLCGEFISPECLEHFKRLGVLESMTQAGGTPLCETLFYSRRGASVSVPSAWFGTGQSLALGLSRAEMDERLIRRARAAGVVVLEEAHATSLLMEEGRVCGVRLRVAGEVREYTSRVAVDATGRARALSRHVEADGRTRGKQAGKRTGKRAPLVAFKAHLEDTRVDPLHCEIYFYRGGYGGLSSVEGGRSNLCFIVSARDARRYNGDAERMVREIVATNRRAAWTLAPPARPVSEWLGVALDGFGRREIVPADGLLAVGDAASFIDPFTGSGMLMALESGELAALAITRWLELRHGGGRDESAPFDDLARAYRALYAERFSRRLRVCSMLRRAAFVPRLAEAAILALGPSERLRRRLARSTRRPHTPFRGKGRAA
ncbi:MAG TPA: NAD(P)/FAD-dependent oxidoreductase [Pyrinomonadaceae bacterium]|jgi:flavin-dependent dehydrogenase|nr:NAD(P)/FAD-dependent oxidoreductase [Pyrinomonadaceae bacterium]